MQTRYLALVGATLLCAGAVAIAADDMKIMMDANKDGMVSKDEYMKYHEDMWAKMKKGKGGMVDLKDMGMMHEGKMKDGKMMKDDKMQKDELLPNKK